jgi:biopolymer transport protein ExbB/TolQ
MVLGEFTAEALSRARCGPGWWAGEDAPRPERAKRPRLVAAFLEEAVSLTAGPAALEKLLADCEVRAAKWLEGTQIGVRLGPMLGLVGTLIPMGRALQALGAGDVAQIAANMRVAFATTVAGLLIGGLCYTLTVVRRRWYTQDLNEIEFLSRELTEDRDEQTDF